MPPTNDLVVEELENFGVNQLGGTALFDGSPDPQERRLFQVELDPAVCMVWSVLYMPGTEFDETLGFETVDTNDVIGRLSIGAGGGANVQVEFDWSAGGVIQVPACTISLTVAFEPIVIVQPSPVSAFQAFVVPGVMTGARGPNYLTRFAGVFANLPVIPALGEAVPVPVMARRWTLGTDQNFLGFIVTLRVQVFNSVGVVLETWQMTRSPGSAVNILDAIFSAEGSGGIPLPRGAAFLRISQSALGFALVNIKFELGL